MNPKEVSNPAEGVEEGFLEEVDIGGETGGQQAEKRTFLTEGA